MYEVYDLVGGPQDGIYLPRDNNTDPVGNQVVPGVDQHKDNHLHICSPAVLLSRAKHVPGIHLCGTVSIYCYRMSVSNMDDYRYHLDRYIWKPCRGATGRNLPAERQQHRSRGYQVPGLEQNKGGQLHVYSPVLLYPGLNAHSVCEGRFQLLLQDFVSQ